MKTNVAPAVVKTTVIHPSLDSSSDSDGPGDSNGLTIENVLAGINAKFPSHDFLKFRAQLIDNVYTISLLPHCSTNNSTAKMQA